MTEEDIQQVLAAKLGMDPNDLHPIDVTHSASLDEAILNDPRRYAEANACFTNCANVVVNCALDVDVDYVLVYAIRCNGDQAIAKLAGHPEMRPYMLPLSDSVYAFGHALVRNYCDEEYYDPTAQGLPRVKADYYFWAKGYEENELIDHITANDMRAPEVQFTEAMHAR